MEKQTRETFIKWTEDNHWLAVEEPPNPNGRQVNFVTPTGNFVAAIFDLEGQLITAVPLPPMIQQVRQVMPGPGSGPHPFMGKG